MVRKTQQVETRLIAEYVKEVYAAFPVTLGQPLGVVSEELMAQEGYAKAIRMSRPNRPEVDALVLLPRYLLLIEAKVWHIVDGMAKLPLYKSLIPYTPELRQYRTRGVMMELVVPWSNPNLEIMCREADIQLKVFTPPWIEDVVKRITDYGTREYRLAREEKLRQRELAGLG